MTEDRKLKVRAEVARVAKFSVVGLIAFVVDVALFNILRLDAIGVGPLWAKIWSVAGATAFSWVGSRYWTFKDGRNEKAAVEALWFFFVNAVGLLIAMACLWFSHYLLGLTSVFADNVSGNVVGVAIGNIFRYFMYRFVIYRVNDHHPAQGREVVEVAN